MRHILFSVLFLSGWAAVQAQYADESNQSYETTSHESLSFYNTGYAEIGTPYPTNENRNAIVANGTVLYPEKSYFVPYHVKQNQTTITEVAPPPVLWGDELYYPYQLSRHARFEHEADMNRFMSTCYPGTGCAVRPAVICRRAGCTRINDRITKQFLFNSLIQIFLNNKMSRVDLCEADPNSRACLANSIRFGGQIGGTPVLVQIPSFTLVEMKPLSNLSKLELFITYDLYANGLKSRCSGAMTTIEAVSSQQLIMRDNTYQCDLTYGMPTTAFSLYNIDYIDLDYGIIGAFYSVGLSGESAAGGTGYVLMKFKNEGMTSTDFGTGALIPEGNYTVKPYTGKSEDEEVCEDPNCGEDEVAVEAESR